MIEHNGALAVKRTKRDANSKYYFGPLLPLTVRDDWVMSGVICPLSLPIMDAVELQDLSKARQLERASDTTEPLVDPDDAIYTIPAAILLFISLIFLGFPRFVLYLASNVEHAVGTPLERFLLSQLGIYFFVVAASLLLRVLSKSFPSLRRRTDQMLRPPNIPS